VKRLIGIAFYLLVAVFLVLYAQGLDYSGLENLEVNFGFVALATLLALSHYWQGSGLQESGLSFFTHSALKLPQLIPVS